MKSYILAYFRLKRETLDYSRYSSEVTLILYPLYLNASKNIYQIQDD